jgi:hypothetical protein
VRTVHARTHPRIGARVHVNGTAARVLGPAHRARIHAVVVKRAGNTTLVAAGRALLAIHSSGRRLSSASGAAPATGVVVNTTVGIANATLTQQSMQVVGQTGVVTVQAQVTAVAPGSITVLMNGRPFSISLPAGIQLPASVVGQFVTFNLKLAQAENAENEDEDDDRGEDQDDDHGHDQGHDGHGGHGDDGDG